MSVNGSIEKVDNSTGDEESSSQNDHLKSDEAYSTPVHKRPFLSVLETDNSVRVLDLSKSPKKRKQNVGSTPYSRILCLLLKSSLASGTPIKGSILDIQLGRHPTNSPIPSPKPLTFIIPPQSPLKGIMQRANELVKSLSNSSNSIPSGKSEVSNSKSCSSTSPLKTMLSSSNSKTMMVVSLSVELDIEICKYWQVGYIVYRSSREPIKFLRRPYPFS